MAVNLYDAIVPSYLQTLSSVEGFLAKGAEHCRANNVALHDIVETRVFPDMFPFRFQVTSTVMHSIGAIEGVRKGIFTPPAPSELGYEGLQKAVTDARDSIKKITADEVNGFVGRDMRFVFRDRDIPFTAENFLLSFSMPNFYFHASMAYGILRSKGVPLGKRDFLGQLRIKS